MEFFNSHQRLFRTALLLFVGLTLLVAIIPALNNQTNNHRLPNAPELKADEIAGKKLFIANGCVSCHSQQVRNVDMDKTFGSRPSIAADYAAIGRTDFWTNTATLMGTERTGPDLTNIGNRQPSQAWQLLHLYQPRAVVEQSIMPAYPWLFVQKDTVLAGEVEISVPDKYRSGNGKIVATKHALQLVAYLQSLKQVPLPDGSKPANFLYKKEVKPVAAGSGLNLPDGAQLYTQNCQSCHQASGEGLQGAFPSLKDSKVVNGDNLDLYVNIIMKGYDARPEFATMPAVGLNNNLSAEDVTAIINHEKSSWGNNAKPVTVEEVKKIYDFIRQTEKKQ
ncbi:MAG TPA: cbb3-type cytochrome c oxidase subunit II [Chitinophagaceae bacterium]|nr:cbb3-type cytochrome c oxidase subunit II [Chitinophagaceae bacterium]